MEGDDNEKFLNVDDNVQEPAIPAGPTKLLQLLQLGVSVFGDST